jgi:hypothetical protein
MRGHPEYVEGKEARAGVLLSILCQRSRCIPADGFEGRLWAAFVEALGRRFGAYLQRLALIFLTGAGVSSSLIIQQRLPFLILRHHTSRWCLVLPKDARRTDQQAQEQKTAHNNESKDPLESNDVRCELCQGKRQTQDGQLIANGVVFEDQDIECANAQDPPDRNVGQDAGGQGTSVHHCGTVP